MRYTAEILAQSEYGFELELFTGKRFESSEIVIMSPSAKPEYLIDVIDLLMPDSVLMGGQKNSEIEEKAVFFEIDYINLSEDDTFSMKNAVPTVEGAIAQIIQNTERTLEETTIGIVGFGKIGSLMANRLYSLGSDVVIFSSHYTSINRSTRYSAYSYEELQPIIQCCDVVVNTAPNRLITDEMLSCVKPYTLLMELASYPYGFCIDLAKELGLKTLFLPGLPAKVAPYSAAVYLSEVITKKLKSGGYIC